MNKWTSRPWLSVTIDFISLSSMVSLASRQRTYTGRTAIQNAAHFSHGVSNSRDRGLQHSRFVEMDLCSWVLDFTSSHIPGFRYVPPVDPNSRVSISPQYGSVKSDRSCVVCRRDLDSAPWWLPRPRNLIEDSPSLQARWIQLLIIPVWYVTVRPP